MKTIINVILGTVVAFCIAVVSTVFGAFCGGVAVAEDYALHPDEAGDSMMRIHEHMESIRKRHKE